RAGPEQLSVMADEVASMFASLEDPQEYLRHDVQFHRAVAAGSLNPVLATLIDTVAELVYETRRLTVEHATDLRESAEMHRRIYQAIKARDPERARREMDEHLDLARHAQGGEETVEGGQGAARAPARRRLPPPVSRSLTITGVRTHDVRFPTSRQLDGSDALNLGDYSAAYV